MDAQPHAAVFTQGSTLRHVLAMTGAASVGLMALFVVDLLSLIYVSRLGDPALTAAVGFATQVLFISVSVAIGLAIAIGALVSRAIGAGDRARARRLASSGLVHVVLVSGAAGAAGLFARNDLLRLLGAQGEALDVASSYLLLTLPATVGLGLGMALAGVLRAVGDARRAMYVTLAGAATTAALDPLLIFHFGLGVQGAAIATIVSRLVFVVVGLHGAALRHGLVARPRLRAALADARPLYAIAFPAVLTNLAAPVGSAYVMRAFSGFGEPAVAALAMMDRVAPVVFGPLLALSGAVGPILGQNFGARRHDRLRRVLSDSLILNALYVVLVWLALTQATGLVVALFSAHGETADLLRFFVLACGPLWFFLGGVFVANATFNNLGFPLFSTFFNWGRATLGVIPFVAFGAARFGPRGGYVGLIAGAALFGCLAVGAAFWALSRLAREDARD